MTDDLCALSGVRIVDFSHVFQGPMGSQLLADFGADVIKVERPGSGDWSRAWGPFVDCMSLPFANLNRNKRSLSIDLKSPAGREVVLRLLETADVLMHNFRPGVMEGLGMGYEDLRKINPRLVYAYSTGWGDKGPYVEQRRPGHDLLARAAAGWLAGKDPGQPPAAMGISADYPAGLMLVIGILLALQARERTGQGQEVTTDLYSVALHANTWEGGPSLNRSRIEDDGGIWATEAAIDKVFETKDGYIEFSPVFSADSLRDVSVAMGLDDLSQDPRFVRVQDRLTNKRELNQILAQRFRQKTTAEWIAQLEPQGILCGKVRSFEEAVEDPQTAANEMVIEAELPSCGPLSFLGTPLRLRATPPRHRTPPPKLGEQTDEVLQELGYSPEEIASLRQAGTLG